MSDCDSPAMLQESTDDTSTGASIGAKQQTAGDAKSGPSKALIGVLIAYGLITVFVLICVVASGHRGRGAAANTIYGAEALLWPFAFMSFVMSHAS